MRTYLITYDLKQYKDYVALISAIKQYTYWAKPLESVWLIKSNSPTSQIRDYLRTHIDADDKLLVVDITSDDWGTYNISQEVTDWMKSQI